MLNKIGKACKFNRKGYLMVEVFSAICVSLIVMSTVAIMFRESNNLVMQTDNRIELMEQFSEIQSSIKRELRNSNNIKFYSEGETILLTDEFKKIDRIKFSRFEDVKMGNPIIKNKEMYVSKVKNKIFIYYNGGAFEIGNYVYGMEAKKDSEDSVSIKLILLKNNNKFEDVISIRLRN